MVVRGSILERKVVIAGEVRCVLYRSYSHNVVNLWVEFMLVFDGWRDG